MNNLRTCRTCKQVKNSNDFYKSKERKDGLRIDCKDCDKARLQKIPKVRKKRAISSKKWADKNRHITRQQSSDYRKNNPDKVLNAIHKRNALKLENGVFFISVREVEKIRNGVCFYCQSKESITIDHIVPLSKGGRHSVGNLISACMGCNTSKGNKLLFEYLQYRKAHYGTNDLTGSQNSGGEPV